MAGRPYKLGISEAIDGEEWRPVPTFANIEASSLGRIRLASSWQLLALHVAKNRRVKVSVPKHGIAWVHVLVTLAFHGPRPTPKHEVAHSPDPTPSNNVPGNLRWATRKENVADRWALVPRKPQHVPLHPRNADGGVKLSARAALKIRLGHYHGMRVVDLARMFGVSSATVGYIIAGRIWRGTERDFREAISP